MYPCRRDPFESIEVGVGIIVLTNIGRSGPPCRLFGFGPFQSRAVGVGKSPRLAIVSRLGVPFEGRLCETLPSFWLDP
jgi:hypothetical protein